MHSRKANFFAFLALVIAIGGAGYVGSEYMKTRSRHFDNKAAEAAAAARARVVVEEKKIEAARPPERYVAPAPLVLPIY